MEGKMNKIAEIFSKKIVLLVLIFLGSYLATYLLGKVADYFLADGYLEHVFWIVVGVPLLLFFLYLWGEDILAAILLVGVGFVVGAKIAVILALTITGILLFLPDAKKDTEAPKS